MSGEHPCQQDRRKILRVDQGGLRSRYPMRNPSIRTSCDFRRRCIGPSKAEEKKIRSNRSIKKPRQTRCPERETLDQTRARFNEKHYKLEQRLYVRHAQGVRGGGKRSTWRYSDLTCEKAGSGSKIAWADVGRVGDRARAVKEVAIRRRVEAQGVGMRSSEGDE
jgi:hypothetical protein